ncbi:MAG: hypothetical protein N2651_02125 [Fimbriimonadales bacterium]|nr:hypothetical protein [Fimbriimonadales bacterium]
MDRYDWSGVDHLASEIASMERARGNGAGVSESELREAYDRLCEQLRPAVSEMIRVLLRDPKATERVANEFLDRVPLMLPVRSGAQIPCSRWIASALIDFVYHTNPAAQDALNPQEAHLLQGLMDAELRAPLNIEELNLIDRVRGILTPDEFLVWYDYVVNGYALTDIAALHQESPTWVEQTLQRARKKLWDAVTTDTSRRTRTDVFGQSLTWLGVLRLYDHSSVAHSVATDGTVAGVAFAEEHRYSDSRGNYAAYIACAFRWKDYQFEELGELGENCNPRCMITPDGDKVVVSSDACQLRWDAEQGVQRLIAPDHVYAINACGDVLVGESEGRAVRWNSNGKEPLSDETPSAARAVSPNGKYIAGHIRRQAVCWDTATGVIRRLGTLGGEQSEALAISKDGSVIVGKSDGRAFRWTPDMGMCALSQSEEEVSQAHSVSYDGARIVGEALDEAGGVYAFLWTQDDEMQNLNVLFAHLRELGATLERAYAISPNGRYIVGEGYCVETERKEAFLIDLGELAT